MAESASTYTAPKFSARRFWDDIRRYLEGLVEPRSVRWVGNMRARYGSCTPDDGTIRLVISTDKIGGPHAGDLIGLTADSYYPYTADALTGLALVRIRRADRADRGCGARPRRTSPGRRTAGRNVREPTNCAHGQTTGPG